MDYAALRCIHSFPIHVYNDHLGWELSHCLLDSAHSLQVSWTLSIHSLSLGLGSLPPGCDRTSPFNRLWAHRSEPSPIASASHTLACFTVLCLVSCFRLSGRPLCLAVRSCVSVQRPMCFPHACNALECCPHVWIDYTRFPRVFRAFALLTRVFRASAPHPRVFRSAASHPRVFRVPAPHRPPHHTENVPYTPSICPYPRPEPPTHTGL